MAIEAISAGWTGQDDTAAVPQVCAEFRNAEQMETALQRLEGSAFQRADLSARRPGQPGDEDVTREDDARNLRTLGTSTAAAAAGMAAAAVVVASGGTLAPVVGAAAVAAGATGAAGEAIGQAAAPGGQTAQRHAADHGGLIVVVHAASEEKRAQAEAIMRDCGAARIWREGAAPQRGP